MGERSCASRLLLLDEPWQGLDEELQDRSMALLRHVSELCGAPILFVSHHADDVRDFAEKVINLSEEKIVVGQAFQPDPPGRNE